MTLDDLQRIVRERENRIQMGNDLLIHNETLRDLVEHVSESFLGFHAKTKSKEEVLKDIAALRKSGLNLTYETDYRLDPKARCIKFSLGMGDMALFFYVSEPSDQWA